jgi:hypothetical protein
LNLAHQEKFLFLTTYWKTNPTRKNEVALIPVAGGELNVFANQIGVKILDAQDLGRLLDHNQNGMGIKAPNIVAYSMG